MSTAGFDLAYCGAPSQISDREFNAFRELIYEVAGINLSPTKRALVCSRLAKRLRELRIGSFAEYYAYLMSEGTGSAECQAMINCITTNKTNFFRESHHFDYLREQFLPRLSDRARAGHPRRLRIWSAGCSTGEEPYTIAMSLLQYFGPQIASWDIRVLASDIDTEVLGRARAGAYSLTQLEDVPSRLRQQYFQQGDGDCWQAGPELKRLITFRQINLIKSPWPLQAKFDLIFCRNVLIYFDRETQIRIVSRMAEFLGDDGMLFLGHSENIDWSAGLLTSLGHTMFARKAAAGRAPAAGGGLHRLTARLQSRGTEEPDSSCPPVRAKRVTAESETRGVPSRRLIIGDVVAAAEPVELGTLLGSCVAVCLFDAERGVGGMNHFMLPRDPGSSHDPARYGESSNEALLQKVLQAGGQRERLQAKIFGGAHVLPAAPQADIGDQNVRFARDFLGARGIPIVAECVGRNSPLEVRFRPHTGQAFVRALEDSPSTTVVEEELQYRRKVLTAGVRE